MKVSELIINAQAAFVRWGDIECLLDIDPSEPDLYELVNIFGDINPDNEQDVSLVFAIYDVVHKLKVVK